jgi:hypothetical protein
VIDTVSWGFNVLPHPLHHMCGSRLNKWANGVYDRSRSRRIKLLGEGYIVLCQRNAESSARSPAA